MEAILSRRSIRKYTNEDVSEEIVKELLEAAMSAPSAGNEQPWHFVVIRDRKILNEIPNIHPYSGMLREAPLAILICGDESLQKYKGYWVQDCSAATENLLIAINAKGLGGVWLGVYPVEDRVNGIRKLLDMPNNVIPFSLISIGYPAEQKPPANRYNSSRIHYDRW
ncbi:MAG: nitroreductase family protein [bacterium]